MIKRTVPWILTVVFSLTCMGGLAYADKKKEEKAPPPPPTIPLEMRKRIAVMPLYDGALKRQSWWGSNWQVGSGISDMMVTTLVKSNMFRVIEREQLERILREQKLGTSGQVDPSTAAKVGKILGVEFMIMGKMTEFGLETKKVGVGGFGGGILGGFKSSTTYAKVALDCRIVDTSTGEILNAETGKGNKQKSSTSIALVDYKNWAGAGFTIGSSGFENTILGQATRMAVDDVSNRFIQDAVKPGSKIYGPRDPSKVEGLVVDVEGDQIMTTLGSNRGFKVGDIVVVVQKVKEIKHPETGEVLKVVYQTIAEVKLFTVEEKCSTGMVVAGSKQGEIKVGDVAKLRS